MKAVNIKQKNIVRIIFNEIASAIIFRNFKCIKYLSAECQNLDFMHRFKTDNISKTLTELIKKRKHASIQQSFQKAAVPQNHFPYII